MRRRLYDLYAAWRTRLQDLPIQTLSSFGVPLLIEVDDEWHNARHRLVWIGQEPGVTAVGARDGMPGLSSLADFVQQPMAIRALQADNRHWFNGGRNALRGPFHEYLRNALRMLKDDAPSAAVFTNVVRCAGNLGTGYPIHRVPIDSRRQFLQAQSQLLAVELAILRPTLCIFTSGPRYDWLIDRQFLSCQSTHFSLEDYGIAQAINTKKLSAKLQHQFFPRNTYRTYHPGYLQRATHRYGLGEVPIKSFIDDYIRGAP